MFIRISSCSPRFFCSFTDLTKKGIKQYGGKQNNAAKHYGQAVIAECNLFVWCLEGLSMTDTPNSVEMTELTNFFICYVNTLLLYQAEAAVVGEKKEEYGGGSGDDDDDDDDDDNDDDNDDEMYHRVRVDNDEVDQHQQEQDDAEEGTGEEAGEETGEETGQLPEEVNGHNGNVVVSNVCTNGLYGPGWYSGLLRDAPLILGSNLCKERTNIKKAALHALAMVKILHEVLGLFERRNECRINRTTPAAEDISRLILIYSEEDPTMQADAG